MTSNGGSGDIFDVKRIRRLVELMNERELGEIDLKQADQRIRIKKGRDPVITSGPPAQGTPATAQPAQPNTPAAKPAEEDKSTYIKSPMVGTFYASPGPDSPPFVKVGDHVGSTTTVCIIEAMKVFNEIPAEIRGKVVAVLCEEGEAVEFDKPLFKVDTSE